MPDSPALRSLLAVGWQRAMADAGVDAVEARYSPAVNRALANAWATVLLDPGDTAHVAETMQVLRADLTAILRDTAVASSMLLGLGDASAAKLGLNFRLPNPYAEAWAATRAGELVAAVEPQVRDVLRREITTAALEGTGPGPLALRLQRHVGLTPMLQAAVDRHEAALIGGGTSPSRARRMANAYATRLRAGRATTIARTELLTAYNTGQHLAWQSNVNRGLIPTTSRRLWIITRDDKTCPSCRMMVGPRAITGLNDAFDTPYGARLTPPMHPMCRCSVGLVSMMSVGELEAALIPA